MCEILSHGKVYFPPVWIYSRRLIGRYYNWCRDVAVSVPSSGVGEFLHVADANATSGTRATDIEIHRGISSWRVAEYETGYADSLKARRFGVVRYGAHSIMFGHRNVCQYTIIAAWNRRGTHLRRRWPETLKDVPGSDTATARHTESIG